MRACATANAVVLGLVLGSACFAACSNGSQPPQPPSGPDAPPPPGTAGADMPSETPPPPSADAKKTPQTMADCKDVTGGSSLVNEPGGGTVMNNAMTSGDAGSSDRMQPLIDIVKTKRDAFRCCFDLWSKTHPGVDGKVLMVWSLKAKGELDKVTIDASKSTLKAPEVDACMINIAQGLSYPPSPSAKLTTFSYPFEFRAHK